MRRSFGRAYSAAAVPFSAGIGTGNVDELFRHVMEGFGLLRFRGAIVHFLTVAAARNEAAGLEEL